MKHIVERKEFYNYSSLYKGEDIINEKSYSDYPASASNDAKQAIEWKEKYPDQVKAGTRVGWIRARQLVNKEKLTEKTIRRMKAFFDRHQKNKSVNPDFKNEPWRDNGLVAWKIWGGDAGYKWAKDKVEQFNKERDEVNESDEYKKYCDFGCNYISKFIEEKPEYDNEKFFNYVTANNRADRDYGELQDVSKEEILRLARDYNSI